MYRPVQTVAPATRPVTAIEMRAHSRIDFGDDDVLLEGFIDAAVSHLDGWTGILGRCIVEQTWRQDYDALCRCMRLPLGDVISITSVSYLDTDGQSQTVAGANYALLADDLGGYVRFVGSYSFPSLETERPAVSVTYKAGFATVPPALKLAISMLAAHWYENREAVAAGQAPAELPIGVSALIAPFRRVNP